MPPNKRERFMLAAQKPVQFHMYDNLRPRVTSAHIHIAGVELGQLLISFIEHHHPSCPFKPGHNISLVDFFPGRLCPRPGIIPSQSVRIGCRQTVQPNGGIPTTFDKLAPFNRCGDRRGALNRGTAGTE